MSNIKNEVNQKHELLARKEVCSQLNVSYPTLERWRKKGLITAYSVGAKVRYMKSDVEVLQTPKPLGL